MTTGSPTREFTEYVRRISIVGVSILLAGVLFGTLFNVSVSATSSATTPLSSDSSLGHTWTLVLSLRLPLHSNHRRSAATSN